MKAGTLVLLVPTVFILSCKADSSTGAPELVVVHREGHTFSYDPAVCRAVTKERELAWARLAQCRQKNPVEFTRCDEQSAKWSYAKNRAQIACTPHS